ncbi:MAG: cell division protein FtsA [bacterium]
MPRQKIIVGLDVGSANIRVAVAQAGKEGNQPLQILGVGQAKATGMRKGVVSDIDETAKNIKEAIQIAERTSGIKVESAVVSLGGEHLSCRTSRGAIAVSRADGEISRDDAGRAIKQAGAISLGANREVIQVISKEFYVDSQPPVRDPFGMRGVRLEAEVLILDGSMPFIKNVMKCVNEADVDFEGLVPSPLAAARSVLDRRQKELGALVLDIGSSTTGFCVFEEGDVVDSCVLPVGSGHITNDLAIGLRIGIDVAEKIKLEYGSVLPDEINKRDTINLEKLGGEEGHISRQRVAEIIEARVAEIFELAHKRLKHIDRAGLLPAGIVLVGGGAKLPGLVDLAKAKLKLPSQVGFPVHFEGVVDQIDDPSFATVLGLILSSDEQGEDIHGSRIGEFDISQLAKAVRKFKNWFKGFLP